MLRLVQNYVVCGLEHKLDVLHSFLKSHLKSKTIVFLSSCAQVSSTLKTVHLSY
jgi:ATP-dependent RNA helicase DDX10/DBP4